MSSRSLQSHIDAAVSILLSVQEDRDALRGVLGDVQMAWDGGLRYTDRTRLRYPRILSAWAGSSGNGCSLKLDTVLRMVIICEA